MKKPTNQQVPAKDRAIGLFFDLTKRYGFGSPYHQRLRNEFHPCKIQRLNIDGEKRSIGLIDEEKHLTKLFFFNVELPYMDDPESDPIVYEVDAGKICPASQQHWAKEKVIVRWKGDAVFSKTISINHIVTSLGAYTEAETSLKDSFTQLELSYEVPPHQQREKTSTY